MSASDRVDLQLGQRVSGVDELPKRHQTFSEEGASEGFVRKSIGLAIPERPLPRCVTLATTLISSRELEGLESEHLRRLEALVRGMGFVVPQAASCARGTRRSTVCE